MNIYELEKKATPGPFVRADCSAHNLPMDAIAPDGARVAMFREHGTSNYHNAALWVHCRNNFMKALEALKEDRPAARFADFTCREHAHDCPCCEWRKKRDALISELEEVK